jgi:hypothetical protein
MPEPGPSDPFAQMLADSPALFPHALDPGTGAVTLIRLSEADLQRASFLDETLRAPGVLSRTVSWDQLERAAAGLAESCGFIFHIGHAGSTLLSRLLGAHPRILSLREPAVLRVLAQLDAEPEAAGWRPGDAQARLPTVVKLLSRRFAPDRIPLVKATSYASELADALTARPYGPRAIFLSVRPENFLATILAGENSPAEAQRLAPSRLKRLARRLGPLPWQADALSIGETVAMGWACEMTALTLAAESAGARVLWLDFDRVLADPHAELARCFEHLSVEANAMDVAAILAGPDMTRYSKAPEHPYDAAARARALDTARGKAGEEIARGLAWLESAAAQVPAIRTAVDLSI